MKTPQILLLATGAALAGVIIWRKLNEALSYRLGATRLNVAQGALVLEQDIRFFLKLPGDWQFVGFVGDVFYEGQKVAVATIDPFTLRREGADTVIRSRIESAGAGSLAAQVVANPWMLTEIARKGFQVDGEALITLAGKDRAVPIKTTVYP